MSEPEDFPPIRVRDTETANRLLAGWNVVLHMKNGREVHLEVYAGAGVLEDPDGTLRVVGLGWSDRTEGFTRPTSVALRDVERIEIP